MIGASLNLSRVLVATLSLPLFSTLMSPALHAADAFPRIVNLPDGWLPEGVAVGRGPVIYSGSRRDGAIYAADLRTGAGAIVVPPQVGRIAVGLSVDARTGFIFAAGGPGGAGYVYDAVTGAGVGSYQFVDGPPTFVNDVIVTRTAAYFTDSQQPQIYRVPLGPGGTLPPPDTFTTIPLSGDYQQVVGFNANGIEASADGRHLLIVHSALGLLYRVDPDSGEALEVDLGGASLSNGDGILLRGSILYVVRNRLNQIEVIHLAPDLLSGEWTGTITDPDFDVPTTLAAFGSGLYAVNARFTTPPTPATPYWVVRLQE